jgi:hypothetical protein
VLGHRGQTVFRVRRALGAAQVGNEDHPGAVLEVAIAFFVARTAGF